MSVSWQADSQRVAARLLAALNRGGVKHFFVAPGARSQALALAAEQLEAAGLATLTVRLDERALAFSALGAGLDGQPAVVITTSGTAVANLHPAALEAHHAGVPLILLTADRPAELRGTGANQTTDQLGIFGPALRASFDVAANTATPDLVIEELALAVIAQATGTAEQAIGVVAQPGPVQLNLQFREPLSGLSPNASKLAQTLPERPLAAPRQPAAELVPQLAGTVVLAGAKAGGVASEFAETGDYPLFAEPSSLARFGDQLILRYADLAQHPIANQIRRVVVFGKPTLHRGLLAILSRPEVELVVVQDRHHGHFNPTTRAATQLLAATAEPGANPEWLEAWRQAEAALETPTTDRERARIELVSAVWQAAANDRGKLLLGASELIRVADRFAPPLAVRAYANRGLAGIDGTIATAIGMSIADSGRAVRVLLGDLALLHDAGSLNLSDLGPTNVQLIVGNDRGGGIFRNLEIAKQAPPEVFDRLFITPQQVDFAALAKAYGWNYQPATAANLPELLKLSGPVLIDFAL